MSSPAEDHYYWLTSLLAARGQQRRTSRSIAAVNATMGVSPLALIASPGGPHGTVPQVLAIAIAIYSVGIASLWLGHGWPSRPVAEVTATVTTLAVCVACVIMTNPLIGLFASVTFAFTTSHIAFFHRRTILITSWIMGGATLLYLAWRVGESDPVVAVGGALLVVLLNLFIYAVCKLAIGLSATDVHHSEIEPLTGLLNSDGLYSRTANLLAARNRQDDRHLVMVVVSIDSYQLLTSLSGRKHANQARIEVSQALRETVRRNAIAAHVSNSDFVIADTFTAPDASPLIERVQGAMRSTPSRVTASIGVVCTPLAPLTAHPPDVVIDKVMEAATQAVVQVREAGGNDVRYDIRAEFPIED
ncbi:diguanylate cyclase domain-containing protein [Mycobacterium sp. MAA66]|uniref:diguanylate cyclase domain-containing protein n=1 Tax=Mycobacterium sp. MAA66 TaxID=3156297 RepID=UPI0035167768